jgi:hypothetical protein
MYSRSRHCGEEFARHADIDCNDLVYQARKHHSRGLSRVHGQRFDLIVFLDKRYERTYAARRKHLRIVTKHIYTKYLGDSAFAVWTKAGQPEELAADTDGRILRAYREQTKKLVAYAARLIPLVIAVTSQR